MIIDLNIEGKDVIVIGGGQEGTRKVQALLGQKCNVILISDNFDDYLYNLAKDNNIKIIQRKLVDASILDELNIKPFMVLAATDDKELNRKFVEKARELGALAYAADDPSVSDFIHPAIINIKDTLFIAISTKGASPAMARVLRMRVEDALKDIITDEDLAMIKVANYARNEAINRLKNAEERKRYLYEVINNDAIKTMIKNNKLEDAKKEAIKILERWS
ncbi:MAG: hypothetical protein KatS3mg003_0516 [Candidatus Nitrosocaldaceae archaeon]|nr:MAG: hypothetical protein KatS3mg003_0516 [Candidatus Nitrosocaldaceae archaeon]